MKIENGYYIWNKNESGKLTPNFNLEEFQCQCSYPECVEQKASVELMDRLERVRGNAGFPLAITSGFRCAAHQKALAETPGVETAVGLSQHELGNAADVRCNSLTGAELTLKAQDIFTSLGVARRFVHMDLRPGYRRWSYSY